MINLETAVTTAAPRSRRRTTSGRRPTAFDAVKAAGLDVVRWRTITALDYGQVGLADTFAAATAAGVPIVGRRDERDGGLHAVDHGGQRGTDRDPRRSSQIGELASTWVATDTRPGIALAYTQAQIDRAVASIRAATSIADVVVVYMHWGEERNPCPIALQRTAAKAIANAGANDRGRHARPRHAGRRVARSHICRVRACPTSSGGTTTLKTTPASSESP